jgi:hypothetical protein
MLFFARERIIWDTSDERASASFARMCTEIRTIFFETNIMSDFSYTLCE